jgi:hypothetical protein
MSEHEKIRLTPEEQALKERLMRTGGKGIRKNGTGRVSEEFWKLPKPKDPEGLALKALLDDREHGR